MSEPTAKRRKITNPESTGGARISDPRFANIQSDPRYRLPSKKQKVKLDKRFARAFKNEDYTRRARVDRYGRPVEDDAEARRLKERFDVEDGEDSSDVADEDEEVQRELARLEKKHDPLREGKLDVSSSDEDSSTDEDSESEIEEIEDVEQGAQKEDVPEGEVSTRIAIVNLDWDNIRADDLMAVFSSFLPSGERLLKAAVFPSEFGKERMEREEMEGPPKEIFASSNIEDDSEEEADDKEDDEEDIKASIIKPDDGSEFDSQALRQYQLERLRYFYAVLSFSSKQAAKSIYDSVDGAEYLSTANFFDLRFVPEEMDFSDDTPRDECDRLPVDYKPNGFVTDALQHSKVKLTWDQEDQSRKEAQARAFRGGQKEIDENDLKAYLGSDTSDDEEEKGLKEEVEPETIEAKPKSKKDLEREKARALLGFAAETTKKPSSKKDKDAPLGNIQVTFSSGLSGAADEDGKKGSVFENSPEPQETTAEKYIRKEKERKQKRKDKMKSARSGTTIDPNEVDSDDQAPAGEETSQDHGFDDPFFNEEGLNDPSAKNKIRKEERLKKKREREAEEAASAKQRAELELIMADDDKETAHATDAAGNGRTVQHFDMAEIERFEKKKRKKDKFKHKKDKKGADANTVAVQGDFKMDTSDPRFGKLFENHEFAIDPTNQKLRQTQGMKELMDESRRRKQKGMDGKTAVPEEALATRKKDKKRHAGDGGNSEVRDLVAKLKRKAV